MKYFLYGVLKHYGCEWEYHFETCETLEEATTYKKQLIKEGYQCTLIHGEEIGEDYADSVINKKYPNEDPKEIEKHVPEGYQRITIGNLTEEDLAWNPSKCVFELIKLYPKDTPDDFIFVIRKI